MLMVVSLPSVHNQVIYNDPVYLQRSFSHQSPNSSNISVTTVSATKSDEIWKDSACL